MDFRKLAIGEIYCIPFCTESCPTETKTQVLVHLMSRYPSSKALSSYWIKFLWWYSC